MQDIINTKLAKWQHNLEHLQQRRAELQAALADCDANIMRHQGAILACEELLKAAKSDTDEDEPAGVPVA